MNEAATMTQAHVSILSKSWPKMHDWKTPERCWTKFHFLTSVVKFICLWAHVQRRFTLSLCIYIHKDVTVLNIENGTVGWVIWSEKSSTKWPIICRAGRSTLVPAGRRRTFPTWRRDGRRILFHSVIVAVRFGYLQRVGVRNGSAQLPHAETAHMYNFARRSWATSHYMTAVVFHFMRPLTALHG